MAEYTQDQVMNMSSEEASKAFQELLAEANQPEDAATQPENTKDIEPTTDDTLDKNQDLDDNSSNVNSEGDMSDGQDNQLSNNDDETQQNIEPDSNEQQDKATYQIKANGQIYNTTLDELQTLASKGINYTKKMQKLAPFRRSVSAMQENGITEDDLNQFIEMKKGNKVAIANFLNKSNVDAYDVSNVDSNEASKYQALKYGREQNELNSVIEELETHPQSGKLTNYISSLDTASRQMLINKPDGLRILMSDIENGYFDNISAEANKRAFLAGDSAKPLLDYYIDVANEQYKAFESKEKAKVVQASNKARDEQRNKARLSGEKVSTSKAPKKQFNSVEDVSDEDLRAFEKAIGFIS